MEEAKVDLHGPAYLALEEMRKRCSVADQYENPGPTQFHGPAAITDSLSATLAMERWVDVALQ